MDAQQQNDDFEGSDAESGGESMEALLAQQATAAQKLAGKQVTWVKVIAVTEDSVLVDVGEKREGVIPLSDFGVIVGEAAKKKAKEEGGKAPTIGQRVPVILVGPRRDGTTLLSHKRAKGELGWELVMKAHQEKQRVRGTVKSSIKGGFLVDVAGVSGFLPASLADLRPVRQPERMLGTGVRCYIIELNEAKKQIVLSRKAVLEEEVGKRRNKIMDDLRIGEVKIARVVNASPNGLVVDIGGLEGQVRASDLSWPGAPVPSYERGAKLRVKVLSKPSGEPKEGQAPEPVYFGVKQLSSNPADGLKKKYPPKTVVHGTVTEVGPTGVKFTLKDKQAAFCPQHEVDADVAYKPGDAVSGIVSHVNPTTLEVVVSINKLVEIKDRKRLAQYLKAPPPLTLGQLLQPDKE